MIFDPGRKGLGFHLPSGGCRDLNLGLTLGLFLVKNALEVGVHQSKLSSLIWILCVGIFLMKVVDVLGEIVHRLSNVFW